MLRRESAGDGNFVKQVPEACTESTKKVAPEESRQRFEYVDVASVKKETNDIQPGWTLSAHIVKEELADEISLHEDEPCQWGLKTNSLCDGESVKHEEVHRDRIDEPFIGNECEAQFYKCVGIYSVLQGGDNMNTGIQLSEMDPQIVHISDKTCMETDSQERRRNWYRQVAIEEKGMILQKKRDAARNRYRQMVGEEKLKFLQKKRDAIRNRYNHMTDEEKARILQKLRDARNDRYRQMSGEQKARILQKKRDAARKRYRQMTGEEKVRFLQKKRDAVRNRNTQMVDEDKVHMLKKKRDAARNRYRKMGDEEKERFLQRKRNEVKNRYRQKQVRRKEDFIGKQSF